MNSGVFSCMSGEPTKYVERYQHTCRTPGQGSGLMAVDMGVSQPSGPLGTQRGLHDDDRIYGPPSAVSYEECFMKLPTGRPSLYYP